MGYYQVFIAQILLLTRYNKRFTTIIIAVFTIHKEGMLYLVHLRC